MGKMTKHGMIYLAIGKKHMLAKFGCQRKKFHRADHFNQKAICFHVFDTTQVALEISQMQPLFGAMNLTYCLGFGLK